MTSEVPCLFHPCHTGPCIEPEGRSAGYRLGAAIVHRRVFRAFAGMQGGNKRLVYSRELHPYQQSGENALLTGSLFLYRLNCAAPTVWARHPGAHHAGAG